MEEYARKRMECVEVSVNSLLEFKVKIHIKRDEMGIRK